jgi:serine/threonine-protein kinase
MESLVAAGASPEEMLDRFRREAEVSAKLKHPNIVTIYDIGTADGLTYLAMEFIDGVGLDKIIASTGKLPAERAASLGAQVADALDFAHKHQVVHRDIKPANIMVETGDRVKVADFGIAKDILSGEHLTMTGSLLGTPSYMSPEQARGGALDGRSDLFALGCVLYEMLGGKKAFRGESITALIFKIITEEPPSIRELDPNVPDEMVRIIAKALNKAPEARYQSGRELADDLLALTRAGTSPTVRMVESPTAPAAVSPLSSPTIQSPATARSAISEQPTVASSGRTVPPPVPPTTVTPPPLPPPAGGRPAAAHAPAHAPAPARKGGGAGLLIGLGLVGLVLVAGAVGAGWYFFMRKPATDVTTTPVTEAPVTMAAATPAPPPQSVAPATEPPAATLAPATTLAAATPAPTKRADARTPAPPPPSAPSRPATVATQPPEPMPQEVEEPATDGRTAGRDVASTFQNKQGYNSSGSGYGSTGQLHRRERIPSRIAPGEGPAVRTLSQIVNAEEAFHQKHGRYGTFAEMVTAQTLFLDVPHQGGVVNRPGYRISLEVQKDGFRALATPTGGLRFFVADDSGYIRPGTE